MGIMYTFVSNRLLPHNRPTIMISTSTLHWASAPHSWHFLNSVGLLSQSHICTLSYCSNPYSVSKGAFASWENVRRYSDNFPWNDYYFHVREQFQSAKHITGDSVWHEGVCTFLTLSLDQIFQILVWHRLFSCYTWKRWPTKGTWTFHHMNPSNKKLIH